MPRLCCSFVRTTKETWKTVSKCRFTSDGDDVLGRKDQSGQNGNRPHPLDAEGDPVRPLIITAHGALVDGGGEELANHPAHVDKGGEIRPQHNRRNFRSVGGRDALEGSPWDSY